jgi:hypothetical protein
MRVFHAADERTPKTEDSLVERVGFELASDERVIDTLIRSGGEQCALFRANERTLNAEEAEGN